MPWKPQGLSRHAIMVAILAGQVYKSSASAVVLHQASASQHSVSATMVMVLVIFLMGTCVGCCLQWALRRARQVEIRFGRPLTEYRPPAPVQTPAQMQIFGGPTEPAASAPAAAPRVTATAAAKAAARAVAKAAGAKAKATPKAKAQTRTAETTELRCPLCGEGPMRLKWAGRGGCFWGCSDYPICRGSRRP